MPQQRRGRAQQDPGQEVVVHHVIEDAGGMAPFLGKLLTPIARVTPKHVNPEAFIGLVLAWVNRDERLLQAAQINPGSLVYAMRHCAVLGHLPIRGLYAFVPFRNHKAVGGWEVVGIEEYRGVIERMYRAGGVVKVDVEVVRETDVFRLQRDALPVHEYDPHASDAERGKLMGVYSWAHMHTGHLSAVPWLNRHQVKKHRDVSRSGDTFWGPWDGAETPWAQDMWKKTGLHVLERFVPTSAEYRWEVTTSEAAAARGGAFPLVGDRPVRPPISDDAADPDVEVVEAEILDERAAGRGARGAPAAAEDLDAAGWPPVPPVPGSEEGQQ